jgi:phosphoglycolate phosphatase-like HAD superfamily hydrolase
MTAARDWDGIRCVVFDFDGTLVDSNEIKRAGFFEIFSAYDGSAALVDRILRDHPDENRSGICTRVHAELAVPADTILPTAAAFIDAYSVLCEDRVTRCPAVPGALPALHGLALPLYLDSATPEEPLQRVVALRGWTHFFRGVYGQPASKVDNLHKIASREGLAAAEILLIGDGPPDRDAALAFGCAYLGDQQQDAGLATHPRLGPLAPLVDEICRRTA